MEWVDFEIIKTDNREEMVDDSVVERSVGVYSRFHLAANEGRVTQTGYRLLTKIVDWNNTHHSKRQSARVCIRACFGSCACAMGGIACGYYVCV